MLRFPHGIRQAFLRPVWAPFRRCLPLLALLQSCPEDGDDDELLMEKAQHDDGDLLPKASGVDDEGDLLPPASGENREDNGSLLPPPTIDGQDDEEGLLPPARGDAKKTAVNNNLQPLQKGHDDGGVLPPPKKRGQPIHVFDPGGFLHLCEPHSGVKMGILPLPHVTKQRDILLYVLMMGDFDPGGYHLLHTTFLSYVLLTPGAEIIHGLYTSIWLRGSSCNMRNVASLHNIYIDDKNAKCSSPASPRLQAAAAAGRYFLIPLRGRRCDQWNDEVEHEDVAASKMKTERMRLFYLTKDVLDPG